MVGACVAASVCPPIKLVFSIPAHRPTPNFAPSWNAGPTDLARWGLVPYWAKDIKVGFANINAKAEGIENPPPFRKAFQRCRRLLPVDMSGRRP